ncbi:DUF2269 family protein [Sporosarcina sp. HYO08]|uniref:DUF2269 family protein n=1 Tax=Sporosarcina sp. HYO08 TaxID=1759557 RepID=UPI000793BACE|nr:DUF2269 family protein [Sporosarcina sp. HYO08]KXH80644.1 hypothetical protein AU377_07825 [Sporosarcina sp. HYO08]
MTLYGAVVLVHVMAAVVGLGPAFIFPILFRFSKTKEQMLWINALMAAIEKVVIVGSLTLLATGLFMGMLHPYLFSTGWYIASIALYVLAQVLVIGIAGKNAQMAATLLEQSEGTSIPEEVLLLNKKADAALLYANGIAIVMIILMVTKPF